jgi:AcrR family transcriptional regulator
MAHRANVKAIWQRLKALNCGKPDANKGCLVLGSISTLSVILHSMSFYVSVHPMNSVTLTKENRVLESGQIGLRERKQQLTKKAILEAAIDLFAKNGFDETTIDDIAGAAFVSRRTFFRYFESKDDLMAEQISSLVSAVKRAVQSSPKIASKAELLRFVVSTLATGSVAEPGTPKVLEIVARYPAAREALAKSLVSVQRQIEDAFEIRCKDAFTAQVLSSLTISALSLATHHWHQNGRKDIGASTRKVFSTIADIACGLDKSKR